MSRSYFASLIFRWSAFIFLFSRGLLYLIFTSPFRSLLWGESLLRPYVEGAGMAWTYYANHSNPYIQILEKSTGVFLMLASFCFLTIRAQSPQRWQFKILVGAGLVTALHIFLKFFGHNNELPILPEYVLQGVTPWVFLTFLKYFPKDKSSDFAEIPASLITFLKVSLACCFIGHGLYAFGWPYQPVKFPRMIVATFPFIDFSLAAKLTTYIGIIDLIVAFTIFIPKIQKASLLYMAIWGGITALARVSSNVVVPGLWDHWNPWLIESTVRAMHAGAPLFLYMLYRYELIPAHSPFTLALPPVVRKHRRPSGICIVLGTLFLINHQRLIQEQRETLNHRLAALKEQQVASFHPGNSSGAAAWQDPDAEPPRLIAADFKTSSQGDVYTDDVFSTPDLPIRFILDVPSATNRAAMERAVNAAQATAKYRNVILETLKEAIVADFQQHHPDQSQLDANQILAFIKSAKIRQDGDQLIQIEVTIPWHRAEALRLELSHENHFSKPLN